MPSFDVESDQDEKMVEAPLVQQDILGGEDNKAVTSDPGDETHKPEDIMDVDSEDKELQTLIMESDIERIEYSVRKGYEPKATRLHKRLKLFEVIIPTLSGLGFKTEQYEEAEPLGRSEPLVVKVIEELNVDNAISFRVRLGNGQLKELSFDELMHSKSGSAALARFTSQDDGDEKDSELQNENDQPVRRVSKSVASSDRYSRQRRLQSLQSRLRYNKTNTGIESSDDDLIVSDINLPPKKRRTRSEGLRQMTMLSYDAINNIDSDEESSNRGRRSTKAQTRQAVENARLSRRRGGRVSSEEYESSNDESRRRSGRNRTQRKNYADPGLDGLERIEVPSKISKPRVVHSKEIFPQLPHDDGFVALHNQSCDACKGTSHADSKGRLICCQGCTFSYHKECIGNRTAREHLVTKISDENFVLQCRRCIGKPQQKDSLTTAYDRCFDCVNQGQSCKPFRSTKLKKDIANDPRALTPDTEVDGYLLYNPKTVLFRCVGCFRAWHFDHLPPRSSGSEGGNIWQKRVDQYTSDFKCTLCISSPPKIGNIVAWRPSDLASRIVHPKVRVLMEDFNEDEREYLVRFVEQSYFQCKWVPGSWVTGAHPEMRRGYAKKNQPAVMTTEAAIEEEWLLVDIVLDVEYSSYVPMADDVEVDLARIHEVKKAYVKFRGLTYDDVVWEAPPKESDKEKWRFWKNAYTDFIHGFYVHLPKNTMKKVEKAKSIDFTKLSIKEQPSYIKGGSLMPYQQEGMNWLYFKWWDNQNAILADEMGLGKTIQIISYLAVLAQEQKIWPFLVVVPHSTVPNWKREIQTWAPDLRVVAYYGSDHARKLSRKYEMFHSSTTDLKCHIVVTSYTCPASPNDASLLRKVPWECLIVDEGQRLKNDASLLYKELEKFKIRHKVLLTGTPLQNNPRELFNLLQFLNPKVIKAQELEEQFGELTNENVPELHSLIRPYFLRRTKAQVLTHLPPVAEVIIPVSMSSLQRKLYKSILSKDTSLIKSILSRGDKVKPTERTKLNNLLMQLRKCVSHPFLYNADIEERIEDSTILHQNLVEAGSKFGLMNIMLPKLKERGHRVLIFSQFLGMLDIVEDFLDGLGFKFHRLDGGVSTLEKQKRIDSFNEKGSEYFAFLLSTRAGGVGINLATADTVIILDPDFNPHQDIQALSRAHRIGQKNKVLVFHIVTRDTAEEKIMQIGKKKLSMDHLIIERMATTADDEEVVDVETILSFGAKKLFDDDVEQRIIIYDDESIENLLDRSGMENSIGENNGDGSAENAFSFARVWENDKGTLEDATTLGEEIGGDQTPEPGFWDRVLREREAEAQREATANREELGRGRRRKTVHYGPIIDEYDDPKAKDDGSDTDFRAGAEEAETESSSEGEPDKLDFEDANTKAIKRVEMEKDMPQQNAPEFAEQGPSTHQMRHAIPETAVMSPPRVKKQLHNGRPIQTHSDGIGRVTILPLEYGKPNSTDPPWHECSACKKWHVRGRCRLKMMGVETCALCGLAHFGGRGACPHLGSETQTRMMMESLRESNEPKEIIEEAKRFIRGRLGGIRKEKRIKTQKQSQNTNPPLEVTNPRIQNVKS